MIAGSNSARPLAGRAAFITGAARRIGRSIALAFAQAGADVAITYRGSAEDAAATRNELLQFGVKAFALHCDVRSEASVNEAVAAAARQLGRLDLVVNNAGIFTQAVLQEITLPEWDAMFESNTRGPFLVARAAYPALKANRGRIINIGSLGGLQPWATHAHYCTSKAALHMLSKTMAKAWAPEISVNCIAPGMIVQSDTEVGTPYKHYAERTPMKRNGTAADIAAAALFFATGPHFITGQLLAVDGGLGL